MNPAEGNPGINHLAQAIQGRIRQNQDADSALSSTSGKSSRTTVC